MKRFPSRADDAREAAGPGRGASESPPSLRVESVQRGASGTAIVAVGGSSLLLRPSQAEAFGLAPASLAPGVELDEGESQLLALAAEAYEAEKKALALLSRAEQSSYMLGLKLEARGFSKKAVRSALDRLRSEGTLSDSRFAEAYAASRLSRRPEGPASILAALRERGIDVDEAKTAIAAVLGPEERASALARAAEKEAERAGANRDSVRRRLRALGFASGEISEYFDRD